MSIREVLAGILKEYPQAKSSPFRGHPVADFVRQSARSSIVHAMGDVGGGLKVEGSAGAGNWATVPWIAIFDPAITESATRGYYVVYLFHATQPRAYLSLNQGTTSVREEFGARAREILRDRADLIRKRISDFGARIPTTSIELGSQDRLPGDYAAGHSLGFAYNLDTLPPETALQADLTAIVRAYRALTYRGGTDADVEGQADLKDEFGLPAEAAIVETRRYAYHRKIERNRTAAKAAKKFHGTRCQACALDFSERYGDIGKGFIEAHHLRAIATLEEGVAVKYDVATDFAVLCSNCHRMIHKSADPSNLDSFRNLISTK